MSQRKNISLALLVAAIAFVAVPQVSGQGLLNFSFGKHSRHSSFNISFGIPLGHRHAVRHVHRSFCKKLLPGHYELRNQQVWVAGCDRRQWVPAVYSTRYDSCGRPVQVLVRNGYWTTVGTPGYYRTEQRRVFIPGRWVYGCGY